MPTLPATAPNRALLIDMTFGVAFVWLLPQGLTSPLLTPRFAHGDPAAAGDAPTVAIRIVG